jgi:hypothetical protein
MPMPEENNASTPDKKMTLIVGPNGHRIELYFAPEVSGIMDRLFRTEEHHRTYNGPFGETTGDDVAVLPDDNPDAIKLFIAWFGGRDLPKGNTPRYLRSLCDLYKFAVRIPCDILEGCKTDHILMDSTIDMIHYTLERYNLSFQIQDIKQFHKTCGRDSGLYKLALQIFEYKWELNNKAKESPDRKERMTAKDNEVSQCRDIWEATKDSFDLFTDIMRSTHSPLVSSINMVSIIQWMESRGADPRTYQIPEFTEVKCRFHVHPRNEYLNESERDPLGRRERKFWYHRCDLRFPRPEEGEPTEWDIVGEERIQVEASFGRPVYILD